MLDAEAFAKLDPEVQKILTETAREMEAWARDKGAGADDELRDKLAKAGMAVNVADRAAAGPDGLGRLVFVVGAVLALAAQLGVLWHELRAGRAERSVATAYRRTAPAIAPIPTMVYAPVPEDSSGRASVARMPKDPPTMAPILSRRDRKGRISAVPMRFVVSNL